MTTGYTAAVQDGSITEFPAFAMQCARAFGALVTLRDEPMDAPVPEEFTANTKYNDERIAEAQERLGMLGAAPLAAIRVRAAEALREAQEAHAKRQAERVAARTRYEAMLTKVRAWTPPTADHSGLRDFMVEQLETSIKFDCSGDYDKAPDPASYEPEAWRAAQIAEAKRSITYQGGQRAEEMVRAVNRTSWVKALRASLKEVA